MTFVLKTSLAPSTRVIEEYLTILPPVQEELEPPEAGIILKTSEITEGRDECGGVFGMNLDDCLNKVDFQSNFKDCC